MGRIFETWSPKSNQGPESIDQALELIKSIRSFKSIQKVDYGTNLLKEAAQSILEDIENNKKILVWGDYDVDGVTSVISLLLFFQALDYKNVDYKIPDRFTEGYGLNEESLNRIIDEKKPDTIITVDAGITSIKESKICRERGVKLIVTDHHKIDPDRLPDAVILNPKLHENPDYQELCGCATIFTLLRHLARTDEFVKAKTGSNVDLWVTLTAFAGIATICDVVPLNSVNHFLARTGMKCLAKSKNSTLRELMNRCAPEEIDSDKVDEVSVAFRVGPVINSVGRLAKAEMIVKWFFEKDYVNNVTKMIGFNKERREIQGFMEKRAMPMAEKQSEKAIIIIGDQDFHEGVVGIMASRIVEKYYKPVLVYSEHNGICKGSGRSIKGFSLYDALFQCQKKGLFEKFGGHDMACGFSFKSENLDRVQKSLNDYADSIKMKAPEIWVPEIDYDFDIPFELIGLDFTEGIEEMKPFGNSFETPVLKVRCRVAKTGYYLSKKEGPLKGQPAHTWFEIKNLKSQNSKNHRVLFFNRLFEKFQGTGEFLFKLKSDYFRGNKKISVMGVDFNPIIEESC